MTVEEQLRILRRGSVECHTEEDLRRKLASGRKLRVKLGVDPTSPDLHLGHTVVLNRLRAFQDLGHTAVLILGDFTATIGDPSGRDATRPTLSGADLRRNAETYEAQAFKVLDPARTELRWNSEWLRAFVEKDLLGTLRRYTVGQLLQREDFAARMKAAAPLTLLEILYPVFQGYDSVAVRADVELGGNDQLFNLLMGRQMQRDAGQEPQVALTFPLLVGLDGAKKMSKSYGNYVAVNDPPREMFGKLMKVSDELMYSYYELLTQEDLAAVQALHPLEAKKRLAQALTARFHGDEAGRTERGFFDSTFSKKELPQDVPVRDVPRDSSSWSQVLVKLELVASRKEAQRLISQGAFRIDGDVTKKDALVAGLADGEARAFTLQVGKHQFVKVRFTP